MKCIFVMFHVTGPKVNVVVPAQKTQYAKKCPIEELGLENGIMNQFMKPVDHEVVAHAVKKNEWGNQPPRQQPGSEANRRTRQHQQPQIPADLQEPENITSTIQQRQLFTTDR